MILSRRNFLTGLAASVGLVAAEPVRRYWQVGAALSEPNTYRTALSWKSVIDARDQFLNDADAVVVITGDETHWNISAGTVRLPEGDIEFPAHYAVVEATSRRLKAVWSQSDAPTDDQVRAAEEYLTRRFRDGSVRSAWSDVYTTQVYTETMTATISPGKV